MPDNWPFPGQLTTGFPKNWKAVNMNTQLEQGDRVRFHKPYQYDYHWINAGSRGIVIFVNQDNIVVVHLDNEARKTYCVMVPDYCLEKIGTANEGADVSNNPNAAELWGKNLTPAEIKANLELIRASEKTEFIGRSEGVPQLFEDALKEKTIEDILKELDNPQINELPQF